MRCLGFVMASAFLSANLLPHENGAATQESKAASSPTSEANEIQEILASKYPYKSGLGPGAAQSYRNLFKKIGTDGIHRLQMHDHDGIAIQAAWEEVMLNFPQKEPERAVRLDHDKVTWFLGFLQGRARV